MKGRVTRESDLKKGEARETENERDKKESARENETEKKRGKAFLLIVWVSRHTLTPFFGRDFAPLSISTGVMLHGIVF